MTFTKMITSVSSARVSINTRPRIIAARIAPAAPGLRAMPSHADDATRDWPNAPPKAASAMPNAAEIATQFVPAATAPPCANATGLTSITAPKTTNRYKSFLIVPPMNLPPGGGFRHPQAAGLTLQRRTNKKTRLVLLRCRESDVDRRQQGKYVSLDDGYKDVQAD